MRKVAFQSTLPVWGATDDRRRQERRPVDFNPRSPCGERLDQTRSLACHILISIHAPRVGSDAAQQSKQKNPNISIHAPRVGSDRERRHLL